MEEMLTVNSFEVRSDMLDLPRVYICRMGDCPPATQAALWPPHAGGEKGDNLDTTKHSEVQPRKG